jgi:hypothetical protein
MSKSIVFNVSRIQNKWLRRLVILLTFPIFTLAIFAQAVVGMGLIEPILATIGVLCGWARWSVDACMGFVELSLSAAKQWR